MQNLHRSSLVSTPDHEVPEETTARGSHPSISHCDHPSILWHCGATTYANFIFKWFYQLIGLIWKSPYFNVKLQSPKEHHQTMANWRVTITSMSLSFNTNWITLLVATNPVPKQLQVDHFGCPKKNGAIGLAWTLHNMWLVYAMVVAHLSICQSKVDPKVWRRMTKNKDWTIQCHKEFPQTT